jgi:type III pantothenate kinase
VAGRFIGGAIAPGITTATDALLSRAARLYRVELVRPKDAIGRNTVTNIQSGVVYGYAGLVDGIVERMKTEMDGRPKVVATGGLARLMADVARSIEHVDDDLTLEGLRLLYEESRSAR